MPKPQKTKGTQGRQSFLKDEVRVVEKIVVSEKVSKEIQKAAERAGESKSLFMGRIIRAYLEQLRQQK